MERRMSAGKAVRRTGLVLVAGLLLSTCGPSIIEEVAKDILFSKQYNLTVMSDDHCTAVPEGTVVVTHAEAKAISATADAGYHVTGWTQVSGAAVTFANAASASTTVQLQAGDAVIKVWSEPHDWVLTVSAGTGGTTDPAGAVYVLTAQARAVVATPGTGYHFVNWTLENGSGVTIADPNAASTTVTLTTTDAEVRANFAINQYTLTVTKTGTGTVNPSGSVVVNHGADTAILATPGSINMLQGWTVTAGTGATIANDAAESTTVKLEGGNATVNAAFVEYHGRQVLASDIAGHSDTFADPTDGTVYVAYYDAGGKDLEFLRSGDRGKTWATAVTVDSAGDVGQYCSMTVNTATSSFNTVDIAYYDADNGNLKHVRFLENATSFSPVTVDSSAYDVGKYCQMAWSGTVDNRRCIAYYDATDKGLKVAKTSDGSTWFTETVDTVADVGAFCSITCNTNGDFFMAYADTTSSNVKRAYAADVSMTTNTTWTIVSTAYTAAVTYTGIALNGANGIICFRGGTGLRQVVTTDTFGTVGSVTSVDTSGYTGEYARIRYVAADGAFWISYNRNQASPREYETKLARSADNGTSWTFLTPYTTSSVGATNCAASFAKDGTRLYATYGVRNGITGIYTLSQAKSTDGGVTW
jgi:hypothetical protein